MEETDAIQEDVSTVEEPAVSPREAAMQQILEQLGRGKETQQEEAPEPEPEKQEEPAPVATPQTVRVKVDGEEKDMPIEEVIKGYQKDSVASKRLEEAARKLKEAEQREALIAERERQIQAAQAPSKDESDDDDEIQAAINALMEGDNEAAAKRLKDAIQKGRQTPTPAIDPTELAAKIKADIAAERQAETVKREFQEFVKDNPLFAEPEEGEIHTPQRVRGDYLFDKVYGPQWERGEISYREALNKTAEHVAKEFTPPPVPNTREERKKTVDNIPVAGSARQQAAATVQTVDDVLAEMKKARGQAF